MHFKFKCKGKGKERAFQSKSLRIYDVDKRTYTLKRIYEAIFKVIKLQNAL